MVVVTSSIVLSSSPHSRSSSSPFLVPSCLHVKLPHPPFLVVNTPSAVPVDEKVKLLNNSLPSSSCSYVQLSGVAMPLLVRRGWPHFSWAWQSRSHYARWEVNHVHVQSRSRRRIMTRRLVENLFLLPLMFGGASSRFASWGFDMWLLYCRE
ncbi:hypothetical protein EJB05_54151, partial [Eragrostis curvula]